MVRGGGKGYGVSAECAQILMCVHETTDTLLKGLMEVKTLQEQMYGPVRPFEAHTGIEQIKELLDSTTNRLNKICNPKLHKIRTEDPVALADVTKVLNDEAAVEIFAKTAKGTAAACPGSPHNQDENKEVQNSHDLLVKTNLELNRAWAALANVRQNAEATLQELHRTQAVGQRRGRSPA